MHPTKLLTPISDRASNTRSFNGAYTATGASRTRRADTLPKPRRTHMVLTAKEIARRTSTPLRTVEARLARARREGAPVVRVPHGGRGQPPWGMRAEDYARRIGVDLEMLGG